MVAEGPPKSVLRATVRGIPLVDFRVNTGGNMNVNRKTTGTGHEAGGSTAVRVSRATHARLKALAEAEGTTISGVVDRLVEDARRWALYERVNRQMAEWEADTEAWAAYEDEMRLWDGTLLDGLDPDERFAPPDEDAETRQGAA